MIFFIKITIIGNYHDFSIGQLLSQPSSHSSCASPLFLCVFISPGIEKKKVNIVFESPGSRKFNQTSQWTTPVATSTGLVLLGYITSSLGYCRALHQFCYLLWLPSQLFPSWPLGRASPRFA